MITPSHRRQADALLALLIQRHDTARQLAGPESDRAQGLEAAMAFETLRQRARDLIALGMASEADRTQS